MCEKVCGVGAINYNAKDEIIEEKYGAIVVATGYNPIDLKPFDEFAYAQSKDVVSSLEFERLCNAAGPTNGVLLRPSDGKPPKTIVFIQCVGSRCSADAKKGHEYCSKVCCMKCGIGKCGRCNIGNKYVCKDGPVFSFDQLGELPAEY